MKKRDVIAFFDRNAADWDAGMIRDDEKIAYILDAAGVRPGVRVLDVACGTGVLFGDYLDRKAGHVTAVDISPEMAKIAAKKAEGTCIEVICGDVEELEFPELFDCCVVYNAFPHFPDPQQLIKRLSAWLAPGGRLCVAHGMSLAQLHAHHEHVRHVSRTMLSAQQMCSLMQPYLTVETAVSDEVKYVVVGRRDTQP